MQYIYIYHDSYFCVLLLTSWFLWLSLGCKAHQAVLLPEVHCCDFRSHFVPWDWPAGPRSRGNWRDAPGCTNFGILVWKQGWTLKIWDVSFCLQLNGTMSFHVLCTHLMWVAQSCALICCSEEMACTPKCSGFASLQGTFGCIGCLCPLQRRSPWHFFASQQVWRPCYIIFVHGEEEK